MMKFTFILSSFLLFHTAFGQKQVKIIINDGKDSILSDSYVIIRNDKDTGQNNRITEDTVILGKLIIIKNRKGSSDTVRIHPKENQRRFSFQWDESDKFDFDFDDLEQSKQKKNQKVSTNWGAFDIGFCNFNDATNYASISGVGGYFPSGSQEDLVLQNGKSLNVNIWFFMQRVSLISNVVNLKYGLGVELNNYRFKKNIRFRDEPRYFIEPDAEVSRFDKNKLAADYITLPVMLNFNFTPRKEKTYGFSAGVSAGYLYSARQKLVSKERGKEKIRNDFNLQPWKLSAVAELNLGFIQFYGSYALRSMFRSGLEQTPYTAGLRFTSW